nr:fibronectin type III domain-containing protein [Candidatus Freyarchaeota archaeon]
MNQRKLVIVLLLISLVALSLPFLLVQLLRPPPTPILVPPIGVSPIVDNPKNIHLTYQDDPAYNVTITWQTQTSTSGDNVLYDTSSHGGNPSLYPYNATGSNYTYAGASGYIHQVELTNLTPDNRYYFICGGPGKYSGERFFKTAPNSPNVDFKFVAGGDSRTNLAYRTLVSRAMSHTNPSFVMHSADMVDNGTIQSQWDSWFTDVNDKWIGDNGLTIPVVPCLGNHENNATNYYEQFALKGNEQWYYLDWGPNLRIIILNSEATSQISEQAIWLDGVLASTPQDTWKIVMFHRNVYASSVEHPENATDLQPWVQLFDQYHVDIVIQGHTHHYHRTVPMYNNNNVSSYQQGTMYLTTGGWGAPLHNYVPQPYSANGSTTLHFTLISVFQNGTLHLEAKDLSEYTFDDVWLNKNPILDKPKNIRLTYPSIPPSSTITIMWQSVTSTAGDTVLYDTVSHGGNPSLYPNSTIGSNFTYSGASGYIHQVELTDLIPDTTYYFICGGAGNYSGERSFKTAPSSVSDFKFVAGGDSRTYPADRTLVSQAMSYFNASFVMHCGDMVDDGKVQSQWDSWFTDVNDNWIGDNGLTIPVIPCLGNHENNATNYYEQFALPENEQWYYLDWGPDLRIIVLNSEAQDQISEQAIWLENVLASTPQNMWKIVMFHTNVYFSGGHENATFLQPWVQLFDEYHVDIVIQGHTHHYHRTLPMYNNTVVPLYENGTMYLTTGRWGAPPHNYEEQPYSAWGNSTLHFTLINVFQNGTLYLEAKDISGYTFDSVWLTKY